jgi:hypothetical protein
MKKKHAIILLTIIFALSLGTQVDCDEPMNINLNDYLWKNRILLLFAPSPELNDFKRQIYDMESQWDGVLERHLIIIEIISNNESRFMKEPLLAETAVRIRSQFGIESDNFAVILIGKDGTVKLRKSEYVPLSEIFNLIDAMPMRQKEMQQRKAKSPP